jgi:hypothetical protein
VVSLEEPFAPERYLEAIKLLDIKKPTVLVKQHFLKLVLFPEFFNCFVI